MQTQRNLHRLCLATLQTVSVSIKVISCFKTKWRPKQNFQIKYIKNSYKITLLPDDLENTFMEF